MAIELFRMHIGDISIESGRLIIVDPVYLRHWRTGEYVPEVPQMLNSYDEALKLTGVEPWYSAMFDGAAVVVAAPDGDGIYPVYGYFTEDGMCDKLDVVLGIEAADWQDVLGLEFQGLQGQLSGPGGQPLEVELGQPSFEYLWPEIGQSIEQIPLRIAEQSSIYRSRGRISRPKRRGRRLRRNRG